MATTRVHYPGYPVRDDGKHTARSWRKWLGDYQCATLWTHINLGQMSFKYSFIYYTTQKIIEGPVFCNAPVSSEWWWEDITWFGSCPHCRGHWKLDPPVWASYPYTWWAQEKAAGAATWSKAWWRGVFSVEAEAVEPKCEQFRLNFKVRSKLSVHGGYTVIPYAGEWLGDGWGDWNLLEEGRLCGGTVPLVWQDDVSVDRDGIADYDGTYHECDVQNGSIDWCLIGEYLPDNYPP